MNHIATLDDQYKTTRVANVAKWFNARMKRDKSKDIKKAENTFALGHWKAQGINVYDLRHLTNPAPQTHTYLRAAFDFILQERVYAKRDMREMLQGLTGMSKAEIKRYVDEVTGALIEAGVVKEESRGIFCLIR